MGNRTFNNTAMFSPTPIFGALGAADILQRGITTTQNIGNTWNQHWLNIFQSQLYGAIVALSGFFAAGALVFFMVQFIRRMTLEEDYASSLQSLILAIIICILLANNASLLGKITLGLRGVVHNASEKVLATTLLEVNLQDAIQSSIDKGSVSTQIGALLSQCQGLVGERQVDCMKSANQQAQQLIQDYQNSHPGSTAMQSIAQALGQGGFNAVNPLGSAIGQGIEGAGQVAGQEQDPLSQLAFGAAGFGAGFLGSISQSLIQVLLLAFQWAFANVLEIAMLLTGLMGPIAVAGAFMYDGKSAFAWLTGFFSLGMAQICYNIIVGIAAVVVVKADVTDTLGFLVIMALLAPALALALAAGGGMAVFHVVNSGAASIGSTFAGYAPMVWRAKAFMPH